MTIIKNKKIKKMNLRAVADHISTELMRHLKGALKKLVRHIERTQLMQCHHHGCRSYLLRALNISMVTSTERAMVVG